MSPRIDRLFLLNEPAFASALLKHFVGLPERKYVRWVEARLLGAATDLDCLVVVAAAVVDGLVVVVAAVVCSNVTYQDVVKTDFIKSLLQTFRRLRGFDEISPQTLRLRNRSRKFWPNIGWVFKLATSGSFFIIKRLWVRILFSVGLLVFLSIFYKYLCP